MNGGRLAFFAKLFKGLKWIRLKSAWHVQRIISYSRWLYFFARDDIEFIPLGRRAAGQFISSNNDAIGQNKPSHTYRF